MATPVFRLGLIGYGTVGSAFAHALRGAHSTMAHRFPARLQLARIAVRRPDRVKALLPDVCVTDDAASVATDSSLDLIVEVTGDTRADQWLQSALQRGAAAISANKLAISRSLPLLSALAERHPLFACEGAVCAAVPIVRALRDSLIGEEIFDLRGILNGTSTHILSAVETGRDFPQALANACALGIAEGQACGDLSGEDAASKLAILATLAWGNPITRSQVRVRGIDAQIVGAARAAYAAGRRIRLIAEATRHVGNKILLVVEPRELDATSPLGTVNGVTNAIELRAALAGQLRWFGPGAGGAQTASALLGDVAWATRALAAGTTPRVAA